MESPAKLEEDNLSEGATGFNDVNVTDSVQTGSNLQVELIGQFETINSRAQNVKIQLDESTNIQNLVLNVLTTVLGTGTINTATINQNAGGSVLSSRPENMVLHANSVSLRDESGAKSEITESYSSAESAEIKGIKLGADSIKVNMSNFVAGLTEEDFNVSAKLDGQDIALKDLDYDADNQRFTFDPVSLDGNIDKGLEVTVSPSESGKVTGTAQSDETTIQNGFSGRITDVQGVGIAGVTINFREGSNSRDGDIAATVVTDDDGYYTAYLAPGEYTGEISGTGVIKTYMYASSLSDIFNTEQNETAIRATAMDSVKIVLSWGENPYDEDSHLEGPATNGGRFHTWYADKIYEDENGIRYADLDWDDTDSYGPETTTIYKLVNGKYRFYVYNFSNDASLVSSGAQVQIYKGNDIAPSNTFAIPNDTNNSDSLYWLVFDMTVSDDGKTINVTPVNELRDNMTLKLADTAETSYYIEDEYQDEYEEGSIYGEITGVPAGTVADLKGDLSAYDGGVLKVFEVGTDVSDASKFDELTELSDSTALDNGQIVAVKEQDGTIRIYKIRLVGSNDESPVITPVSDADVTTTNAAVWIAPDTTATDEEDGNITDNIITTYSSNDAGSNVTDLTSARAHLAVAGNTVKVTYDVSDSVGNSAIPVSATFTAVADEGVTTPSNSLSFSSNDSGTKFKFKVDNNTEGSVGNDIPIPLSTGINYTLYATPSQGKSLLNIDVTGIGGYGIGYAGDRGRTDDEFGFRLDGVISSNPSVVFNYVNSPDMNNTTITSMPGEDGTKSVNVIITAKDSLNQPINGITADSVNITLKDDNGDDVWLPLVNYKNYLSYNIDGVTVSNFDTDESDNKLSFTLTFTTEGLSNLSYNKFANLNDGDSISFSASVLRVESSLLSTTVAGANQEEVDNTTEDPEAKTETVSNTNADGTEATVVDNATQDVSGNADATQEEVDNTAEDPEAETETVSNTNADGTEATVVDNAAQDVSENADANQEEVDNTAEDIEVATETVNNVNID